MYQASMKQKSKACTGIFSVKKENNFAGKYSQRHYIEVAQGAIFMEKI